MPLSTASQTVRARVYDITFQRKVLGNGGLTETSTGIFCFHCLDSSAFEHVHGGGYMLYSSITSKTMPAARQLKGLCVCSVCVFSRSELPFHFLLGSSPGPAAAAAPLLRWSRAELAPGLGLLEERKRRLRGQRQSRGLWAVSTGMSTETLRDGNGNREEKMEKKQRNN